MIRLDELCQKKSSSIAQKDLENREGIYPIYGASGFIKNVDFYEQEKPYVAVVKDGAGVGRVMILPPKSSVIGTMQYIIPNEDINVEYLAYAMESMNLSKYYTGATIPHIYFKDYGKEMLPEHSVDEQKYIATSLNKISNLISLRKKQLSKLDEFVKSRFIEMFGEVETNVKGFSMKRMDECCKFIGGAQPDKSHFEYEKTDDNIRLIQIRDYKSDRFITYIPKSLARKTCTASDIMIGRYGPPIFQILGGIEGAYNVALMKAVPTAEFNTEYFRYFLKSEKLLNYLESFSQRTAGQDGIQIDKLNAYPCFVPSIELQEQFAAFVEQVNKSKLAIQKSLEQFETLKKSLMQKYFG